MGKTMFFGGNGKDNKGPGKATGRGSFNDLVHVDYESADHSGRRDMYSLLQDCQDRGGKGFFLTVGIDRLSFINEAFGVRWADKVIQETGSRLQELVGDLGYVSRISGDIFGVLIEEAGLSEMPGFAAHLLSSFYDRPLRTDKGPVRIGVSIGGITLEGKDISPASILVKAELALRSAKEHGRGRFMSYEEMHARTEMYRTMLVTGDSFLDALKYNRVLLAYQPVIDSASEEVSFHECLVRMIRKDGTLIDAAEFIPAVEELGLARLLDQYTMYAAIEELRRFPDLRLSVNVSNWSLADDKWVADVIQTLAERPYIASRLIIEITESAVMQDLEKVQGFIRSVKELGCRVALDDFGAGYTAFAQLRNLDIDIVKIDRSFIRNLKDDQNKLFVKTLHALAAGINIETVGEGAETPADAEFLRRDGINHIQGFVYGYPSTERVWLPEDHAERKGVNLAISEKLEKMLRES